MIALVLVFLGLASAELYTPTPAGWVLSHCVHEVPSGTHLKGLPSREILATYPDGTEVVLPLCKGPNGEPVLHTNRSAVPGAPEVYDGWTTYTEFDVSSQGATATFDKFIGNMSVPNLPAAVPQVLYIFPGLQNINWVPVVDPDPTGPFDIIQPVLQYPGDKGLYWSVKSWYVTLDVGTVHSNEVRLNVGDTVYGVMNRTDTTTWQVISTQVSTGTPTSITVDHSRLQYQPWAYNTIECYGCNGCNTYPTQPDDFTGLRLFQGSNQVTANWAIDPQPSKNKQCNEHPVVVNANTIDFDFQF
jgi:hypothetical protein